jgi:hypothetical protein
MTAAIIVRIRRSSLALCVVGVSVVAACQPKPKPPDNPFHLAEIPPSLQRSFAVFADSVVKRVGSALATQGYQFLSANREIARDSQIIESLEKSLKEPWTYRDSVVRSPENDRAHLAHWTFPPIPDSAAALNMFQPWITVTYENRNGRKLDTPSGWDQIRLEFASTGDPARWTLLTRRGRLNTSDDPGDSTTYSLDLEVAVRAQFADRIEEDDWVLGTNDFGRRILRIQKEHPELEEKAVLLRAANESKQPPD